MKTLRLILSTMLLFTCNIMYAAIGDLFVVDGLGYYNHKKGEVKVYASSKDCSGEIEIPDTVIYGGVAYKVVNVRSNAFENCSQITSIKLPSTITTIEQFAFAECSKLNSIELPNSINEIGHSAFKACYNLKNIKIPTSITILAGSIFHSCSSLTSVELPEGLTSIGQYAFSSCSSLTSIELPAGLTSIGGSAFQSCSSLTSIELPAGLTSIGEYTFSYCSSLTSIELPAGLTSIGNFAFRNCSSLTSIKLPSGVAYVGMRAFSDCSKLERIYIFGEEPLSNYNYSSSYIFDKERAIIVKKSAIENFKKAEGWNDLAKYVTCEEYMTKSIEVTASNSGSAVRTVITDSIVAGVVDLTIKGTINSYDIIILNQKMPILHNLDLSEAQIVTCDYPYYSNYCTKDSTLSSYLFYNKASLRSVKLPKKMKGALGYSIFEDCANLRHVVLSEGITSINSFAFRFARSLESVNIPNGIVSVGGEAFRETRVAELILPESVTTIDNSAFYEAELTQVILSPTLKSIGESAFRGTKLTEIRLPSSLMSIGSGAFSELSTLTKVYTYTILPLSIKDGTFSNATNAELYLPETSSENYYFASGWNGFLSHTTFNEPYEYFYLNADKELNDNTGFIEGDGEKHPDADINIGGGIDVGGEENKEDGPKQPLGDVNVENDGNGNSGSMIGNGNLVVDRLHMKITVKGGKWYFFSFPFDVDLKNVWMEKGSKFVFRYYDGEERAHGKSGWKNFAEGELKAGKGYIFQCSANDVLVLKRVGAQFSKEPVYKELSAHASDNKKDASWNFMGNPYLSYYDMNEMDFTAPVTVWDGSKYVAVRPGDDDYHFTPYEAFFVQKPEGTSDVKFDGEKQMTQTQSKDKKAKQAATRKMMVMNARAQENPRKLVNLTLTAGEVTDGTRIVFNNAQNRAYESECDAAKFETQGVIQLFTIGDQQERYAINERPADNGIVMLGFTAPTAGEFSISASRMDTPVYLKDRETGALVDLSKGAYNFTAKAGTNVNRFEVLMEATVTGINQVGTTEGEDAKVYDLGGRRVKENGKGVYIINGEKTLVK